MSAIAVVEAAASAAIYVRRSSKDAQGSERNGRSMAEQEQEGRALAARFGLTVVEVYAEKEGTGASARSRKARPAWERALADLEAGDRFQTLIVWALDRADRRGAVKVAALLDAHADGKRRVLGVDGTDTADPTRRLEIIIRAELAREEAEKTAARVSRAKRFARDEGRWLGGQAPYGLRVVKGRLERREDTYPVARWIAEESLGGSTLWSIAQRLNGEGVPSPRGGSWGVGTLSQLVRAPGFAGLQSTRGRTASGGWQAVAEVYRHSETREPVAVGEGVITLGERTQILARLDGRTRQASRDVRRGVRQVRSLLGDVMRCAGCGGRVASGGSAEHKSYRCGKRANGRDCSAPVSAPLRHLDETVADCFLRRLSALEPSDPLMLEVAARWVLRTRPEVVADRQSRDEVETLEADLARARRLAVSGVLTEDEAAEEIGRLRALLERARSTAEADGGADVDLGPLLDATATREAWAALATDEARALLGLAIREVRVVAAGGRGVHFRPSERVRIVWADGSETVPADL